ncbi:MAG: 8-amino-7-oxononanoate synthase [Alphaproteobacteria bacterium]
MPADVKKALKQLEECGRYRTLSLPCGLDLSSNDYLGLSEHPALQEAARAYFAGGGALGAGGSRLLRGHMREHRDLEAFAAQVFGCERTLFFSSGFQANYALLTTLPARGDIVLYDALVHASVRDGLRAGQARHFKFSHNDLDALEALLKRYHGERARNLWVCVESVYSMEGDIAPLSDLYALAVRYDAMLVVDEAHATGVFGEGGCGLAYDTIIKTHGYKNLVTLHTCGKAIGVAGALICAEANFIDYMVNKARPFIFSTAPMPAQAVLVQKSLGIILSTEGRALRKKLHSLCRYAQRKFGGSGTHIVPLIIGDDTLSIHIAEQLQNRGYDIRAIRPPSVAQGSARLRLSLSAKLDEGDIEDFSLAFDCYC